ncbi:MAG: hypothetical protein Q4E62_02235 [Sutterellaceae bacterium]|nr:hypothetical protein [Sutterellaceae bacterium]
MRLGRGKRKGTLPAEMGFGQGHIRSQKVSATALGSKLKRVIDMNENPLK